MAKPAAATTSLWAPFLAAFIQQQGRGHFAAPAEVAATLGQRVLSLPVLVALVLSMIWRQIGSVRTLVQVLRHEGLLWTSPVRVSPQALTLRLRTVPADLFHRVLLDLLPQMQARWAQRTRPLPPEAAWARDHFTAVLAVDGSPLDALLRKVGLLRDRTAVPLAGRMLALLDVCSVLAPAPPAPV